MCVPGCVLVCLYIEESMDVGEGADKDSIEYFQGRLDMW